MSESAANGASPSPIGDFRVEAREKLWTDKAKDWLDFRSYLRQRRIVLEHPALNFPPDAIAAKDWRGPFKFAIQGTIIASLLVGIVGKAFKSFIQPRPVVVLEVTRSDSSIAFIPHSVPGGAGWDTRQKVLQRYISILSAGRDSIARGADTASFLPPLPYSEAANPTLFILSGALLGTTEAPELSRTKALAIYDRELGALRSQLRIATLAPHVAEAAASFRYVLSGLVLVTSAYLFRRMLGLGGSVSADHVRDAHVVYLYFVAAVLFCPGVLLAIIFAVRENFEKYFPPGFDQTVADLDRTLRSIDEPGASVSPTYWTLHDATGVALGVASLSLLVIWYLRIRAAARSLRSVFELPSSSGKWSWYSGEAKLRKDLMMSTIIASLLIIVPSSLLMWGYAILRVWLEDHRI